MIVQPETAPRTGRAIGVWPAIMATENNGLSYLNSGRHEMDFSARIVHDPDK